MALLDRMEHLGTEHLRREHKKLLSLIDGIEEMLELASKSVYAVYVGTEGAQLP
jgi:hypothetical protein